MYFFSTDEVLPADIFIKIYLAQFELHGDQSFCVFLKKKVRKSWSVFHNN